MATHQPPASLTGIEIAPAPAEEAPPQPSVHEPAVRPWELELLISVSVIFALLQLPAQVEAAWGALEPRVDGGMQMMAFIVYEFVILPIYLMVATFAVHLAVRTCWVGLIGMEAVFPRGVRWDSLPYGPVTREVQRERVGPLQPMIDRADRLASIIFSTLFVTLATWAYTLGLAIVALALSLIVSSLLFGGERGAAVFMVVMGAFILPAVVASWVDQRFGARLHPGSAAHRWLRRVTTAGMYTSGMAFTGPVWLLLLSNVPRRPLRIVSTVVGVALMGFFLVKNVFVDKGALVADSYHYLPDEDGARSMRNAAYENLRPADGSYPFVPSIQSDVVTGPYLRLFVPYRPGRHNDAMRERCPGLPMLGGSGIRMPALGSGGATDAQLAQVLACWTSMQPVKLNGQPIRPDFRLYTHHRTGQRGIIAYIPTAGMPQGENVLEVAAPPRTVLARRPNPPFVIPFWR
jgi:hypothetical protein